jgi:hypothetical protein
MHTLLLAVLLALVLSGCVFPGSPTITPTETAPMLLRRSPDLRGTITEVYVQGQNVKGLFVEGKKEANTSYDRARVGITGDTRIFAKQQREYVTIAAIELRVGQVVEVLFTGPILTSDPVQANAQEIAVVK